MNNYTKKVLDWVLVWLWFLFILVLSWITYAAWQSMTDVTEWEPLTATLWNKIQWNIDSVKTDLTTLQTNTTGITAASWNIGIWVPTPTQKLDVAGTIKATKIESNSTSNIKVIVNSCWGPCPWVHALNTWTNIAPIVNHNIANNDTSTFSTTWTNWTVTINKAWTYMIRINLMQNPTADASVQLTLPIINGSANALWTNTTEQYKHWFYKAGWWGWTDHTFVWTLAAWTTVGYAYYPLQALTYWAHDWYTGMEIIKLN